HDRTSVIGNVLTLEFTPDPQASANRPASQNTTDSTGVYVYPTPVSGAKQPAANKTEAQPAPSQPADTTTPRPAALRAATVIRDVRSEASAGGLRVVIDADGTLQFKDFILSDPWRIVVDITGVRSQIGNRITTVSAGSVDRLRVGQPTPNV